jgi:hypothetical protein
LVQASTWLRRFVLEHGHAFSALPEKRSKTENLLRGKLLDSLVA